MAGKRLEFGPVECEVGISGINIQFEGILDEFGNLILIAKGFHLECVVWN